MKPIDITNDYYVEFYEDFNKKVPKFKVGHCATIFAEGYSPNWSEEIFVIKKIKNTVPYTYVINDLNGEETIANFL